MCQAAVGLVGDLCRGISSQIVKYCDEIMGIMVDTLSVSQSLMILVVTVLHDAFLRTQWCIELSNLQYYQL